MRPVTTPEASGLPCAQARAGGEAPGRWPMPRLSSNVTVIESERTLPVLSRATNVMRLSPATSGTEAYHVVAPDAAPDAPFAAFVQETLSRLVSSAALPLTSIGVAVVVNAVSVLGDSI